MFDESLREQVKSILEKLSSPISLRIAQSSRPDQTDLESFLKALSEISPKVLIEVGTIKHPYPQRAPYFEIWKDEKFTGIAFAGIPTGHEFSSLILAILHADGQGKLPDQHTQSRLRGIKGPNHLITYMSLTCENCPEVVQALNLLAIINGKVTHEVRDGQYFQEELNQLSILGVPTVVHQEKQKIIHVGKASLIDLLDKIEKEIGADPRQENQKGQLLGSFDVIVIGGGPAAVSAAIYTIRKGLKTALIFEKAGGQVSETRGIENMISIPYTEGPWLSKALLEHAQSYPIQILNPYRVTQVEVREKIEISLHSGDSVEGKLLIYATGAKWRELNVPGEKEYLGRGVAYCPHCDGPFYKNKRVAVIGGGNSGVEAAIDLAQLVAHVTLLEFNSALKADQILQDKLFSFPNVTVLTHAATQSIEGNGQKVTHLRYLDRSSQDLKTLELDGVFIQIGLIPNSELIKSLVECNPYGEIVIDEKCRTSHPKILAAGDVTTVPYKQIIIAMGEGAKAGLTAFEKLVLSDSHN